MKAPERRFVIAILILALGINYYPSLNVYGTSNTKAELEQAEKENEETEDKLDETKDNLNQLNAEKDTLEGELQTLNQQLQTVSTKLEGLEGQIAVKLEEIAATREALEEAKETEATQYQSMKDRIQFMYERSEYAYTEMLFGSFTNFGEFLNKTSYIEQLSAYDRQMLEEYEANRILIEEQEQILLEEEQELQKLRKDAETEEQKFTAYVSQTSNSISQYAGNISQAESDALAYEEKIKEQEEAIKNLKKKLAEEMALSNLASQSKWRDISEVTFAEGDRYLLANLIYCEAGGEPYAGQVAVGAVVINRLLSAVYPDTLSGVIYQSKQFSPVGSGRLALALAENRATEACYKAADEAMAGQTNVGNCVYFRTPIEGLTGISIGGHIFY